MTMGLQARPAARIVRILWLIPQNGNENKDRRKSHSSLGGVSTCVNAVLETSPPSQNGKGEKELLGTYKWQPCCKRGS